MSMMAKLVSIFGYLSPSVSLSRVDDSWKRTVDLHPAASVREAPNSASAGQQVGEYTHWLREMRERLED
jgi:hypothetical protein